MIKVAVTGLRGIPATWGGIENHCENLYSRLAEKGYDITIYARNYYVAKDITCYKGLKIKRLPTLFFKYTDALIHTLLSIIHIIYTNPDIVHIHGIGPCFFSWLPRVFRPRMKVFFTCHGLDWQRKKWPWWASKLIYLGELSATFFAHYRIVVSQDLQRYFAAQHAIKTYYIPNGITPLPFRTPDLIKQWGLSTRHFFLCVARMEPEKRMEDIIKAYLLKPRRHPLVIVGDNTIASQYMRDLIELARQSPAIIFTGYQFGAILEELFSNARAFFSASELEGLPITLLEALSCGIMCATSDIPPHRELTATLPAKFFPIGDIEAISSRMDDIEAMDETQLDDFKQKAMTMIYRQFSWDTVGDEHDRLYRASLDL